MYVSKHEFDLKMTKKKFHCGGEGGSTSFEKFIAINQKRSHCCIRTENLCVRRLELN